MGNIVPFSSAKKKGKSPELSYEELHKFEDSSHPLYDPRIDLPIDSAFVEDIRRNGVMQNVLLWNDAGVLWIIAGLQRVKTVEYIKATHGEDIGIPYKLVSGSIGELLEMRVSENAQRQNPSVMLNAYNAALLVKHFDMERVTATMRLGSVATLRNLLELNKLDPELHELVDNGTIGQTLAALHLVKLPRDKASAEAMSTSGHIILTQMEMYWQLKERGTLKGESAKEAIRRVIDGKSDEEETPASEFEEASEEEDSEDPSDSDENDADNDSASNDTPEDSTGSEEPAAATVTKKQKRMRSKQQLQRVSIRLATAHKKGDQIKGSDVARAFLKFILGDDNAIAKAELPKLDVLCVEAIQPPSKKKAGK